MPFIFYLLPFYPYFQAITGKAGDYERALIRQFNFKVTPLTEFLNPVFPPYSGATT
jgi:hypothetical protein